MTRPMVLALVTCGCVIGCGDDGGQAGSGVAGTSGVGAQAAQQPSNSQDGAGGVASPVANDNSSDAGGRSDNEGGMSGLLDPGEVVPRGGTGGQSDDGEGGGAGGAGEGGDSGVGGNAGADVSGGTGGASSGAGGGGEPEPPQCLAAGTPSCGVAAECCADSMCITDGVEVACAALCEAGDQCVSGCCAPVDETNSVCAPANFCPPPVQTCVLDAECSTGCCFPIDTETSVCSPPTLCEPPPSVGCPELVLLANDGTFLGEATSNAFASDGVCNEFGQHGSPFAAESIFNQFGQYGSPFASLSAYNEFSSTPPVLYCVTTDTFFNSVSKNTFAAGNPIDPDALCAVLAANGL